MKLVLVDGSPHGHSGGTGRIARWLCDACAAEDVSLETFELAKRDVRHCNGCGACMNQGTCAIGDDVAVIHRAWEEADLVVLSCPTHVFHITSWMKVFIDRTAAHFHRPPLEGKYAAVVTSSAGMGESQVIQYLSNCLEVLGAACVGAVWGTYRPPTKLWEAEAVRERAERLGRELVTCAREGRRFPQSDTVLSQRRFLRELIWRNRKIFKADFAHWKERGWFD